MKVLLLGSGGREHALAWALAKSPLLKKLYAAPGSDALGSLAERANLDILDPGAVTAFARRSKIDLVLIGPEAPLAAGAADALRAAGISVFGPGREAARLESSKSFAKSFMTRHKIPTARWETFTNPQGARSAAEAWRLPVVVKADGLAAGKGVRVCATTNDALGAVTEFMERRSLGDAGASVVIEDCLPGEELSVLALVDGKDWRFLPFSRDHKRLEDGDRGPNTGGMGAFAPAEVPAATLELIRTLVLDRAVAGLRADGLDYRGLLYAGLMLTKDGPKVLEFNCRFGDPETQAVLPLLESDLLELAAACARGKLGPGTVRTRPGAAVCVVMACEGYPDHPRPGRAIEGVEGLDSKDLIVFHAGTKRDGKRWLSAGGRVLGVTGLGSDLARARERAYAGVERIRFEGMQWRRDIARVPVEAR